MALTGFIKRPDGTPLGTEEEVIWQLSTFFPGVSFIYQAERKPTEAAAEQRLSLFLRIWLYFFGADVPYPRHYGFVESPAGWAIEFYFPARLIVPWVQAISYGRTTGLDDIFERLRQETGWVTQYPP
jgi:hypothetical protein